jgi:hypothetical protein
MGRRKNVKHLQGHDSWADIADVLGDLKSFRTWMLRGLRGRARADYYSSFRFTDPGLLPADSAAKFLSRAEENIYTIFLGESPVAWYSYTHGWEGVLRTSDMGDDTPEEHVKVLTALEFLRTRTAA